MWEAGVYLELILYAYDQDRHCEDSLGAYAISSQ